MVEECLPKSLIRGTAGEGNSTAMGGQGTETVDSSVIWTVAGDWKKRGEVR